MEALQTITPEVILVMALAVAVAVVIALVPLVELVPRHKAIMALEHLPPLLMPKAAAVVVALQQDRKAPLMAQEVREGRERCP